MGHTHQAHQATPAEAAGNRRRLRLALGLTLTYMLAEIVGGLASNSLALLADAGHMFSDSAALTLSLVAVTLAQRPATAERTYGFHRAEIIAALVNGAALLVIAVLIVREAIERLADPPAVQGALLIAVAVGGLIINLVNLKILGGDDHANLNVKAARLHVFTDTLGSIGAIAAGVLIAVFGWRWADAGASFMIAALVIYSAGGLVKETLGVLMQGVPDGIEVEEVTDALQDLPGVLNAHDLHVWSLTSGRNVATAHLVVTRETDPETVIDHAHQLLATRFEIRHATIQVECEERPEQCHPCDDGADPRRRSG